MKWIVKMAPNTVSRHQKDVKCDGREWKVEEEIIKKNCLT